MADLAPSRAGERRSCARWPPGSARHRSRRSSVLRSWLTRPQAAGDRPGARPRHDARHADRPPICRADRRDRRGLRPPVRRHDDRAPPGRPADGRRRDHAAAPTSDCPKWPMRWPSSRAARSAGWPRWECADDPAGPEVRADPEALVRLAKTTLTSADAMTQAWSTAQGTVPPGSAAYGNSLGSGPPLATAAAAAEAAQRHRWGRLTGVYEGDVDRLYRVAFAYRQADVRRGRAAAPGPPAAGSPI